MIENRSFLRISKELKRISKNPPVGIGMWAKDDKLETLDALIEGQVGSPYEGGEFKLIINIPSTYPNVPPIIKFQTQIYHPNIDKSGRICLDTLKPQPQGKWAPNLTLETLLQQIQLLMTEPNPTDPLEIEISHQFVEDNLKFREIAKQLTNKYAIPKFKKENETLLPIENNDSD